MGRAGSRDKYPVHGRCLRNELQRAWPLINVIILYAFQRGRAHALNKKKRIKWKKTKRTLESYRIGFWLTEMPKPVLSSSLYHFDWNVCFFTQKKRKHKKMGLFLMLTHLFSLSAMPFISFHCFTFFLFLFLVHSLAHSFAPFLYHSTTFSQFYSYFSPFFVTFCHVS